MKLYEEAKERYAALGSDAEEAMKRLASIKISMHCWQGDDVKGFLFAIGSFPAASRPRATIRERPARRTSFVPTWTRPSPHSR